MSSEHAIQNEIRNAFAGRAHVFRANVGQAWQGDAERQPDGSILLRNPRPFVTGLPTGFSDLFGFVRHTVTEEDVGRELGVFLAVEVKTAKGKPTEQQERFIGAVQKSGGRAGVARSVKDALAIAELEK